MSDVFEMAMLVIGVMLGTSVIPGALWWWHHTEARAHWPARQIGTEPVSSQYREGHVPKFSAEGVPMSVRVAAIGAWGLGQMFLPGLALGLFGLIIMIGVVSIPGLILAWKLFFLGKPLLHSERGTPERARSAAVFARVLNVLVILVTLGIWIGSAVNVSYRPVIESLKQTSVIALPTLLYAMISMVHASFLDRAADAVEANIAARDAVMDERVRVHFGDAVAGETHPTQVPNPFSEQPTEAPADWAEAQQKA